jgi:hypothetical protein
LEAVVLINVCIDGIWIAHFALYQHEQTVTANAAIVQSIAHSPLQINPIFIVLFKRILDPVG